MIRRDIKEKEWDAVYASIVSQGRNIPLSKQYDLTMNCNGTQFILRVQPETKRRLFILQALEVCGYTGNAEEDYILISNNAVLSSLVDMYLYLIKHPAGGMK